MDDIIERCLADLSVTVLTLLCTVILPYAAVLLRQWLKAKTAAIEDEQLRGGVEWALERLDKTAETVVREIGQVLVQRANGRVIKPELMQQTAVNRVYNRVAPQALRILQEHYDHKQLNLMVRGKIESKVKPA